MKIKKFSVYTLILVCFLLLIQTADAINEDLRDELIELNAEQIRLQPEKKSISNFRAYLEESDYLTSDWRGIRSRLEERGIDFQSSYQTNSFLMRNNENKKTKGTYQGIFSVSTELDTEKLGWWNGGTFFISAEFMNKGISSPDFLNTFSSLNSNDPGQTVHQIGELYYQHVLGEDKFSFKIGRQDTNADFQSLDTGGEFIGVSHTIIPNSPILNPPCEQMGIQAKLKIAKNWYLQSGFFDDPDGPSRNPKGFFNGKNGYLNLTEAIYLSDVKGHPGKYILGTWLHTGDVEKLSDNGNKKNTFGAYASFEQKILHALKENDGGLSVFGQFGYTSGTVNEVPYYFGGGLVWQGISENRKDDKIGLGFARYQTSDILQDTIHTSTEKVVEFFYKYRVTNFLYLQPGIQYIINPGGQYKNSFAFGLRSELIF